MDRPNNLECARALRSDSKLCNTDESNNEKLAVAAADDASPDEPDSDDGLG